MMQFKSLNGTDCTVNIYEEGYTGSIVNELTPAAVPFEYQEDDSNDLTNFIRIKTGYIRVVETSFGELDNLMPKSLHHHFVEAYYGSERVFTGFMQCQEFENDWVASPRELEFPIVSPMGLLDSFSFTPPSTPGLVTLGSLMNEVLIGLNPAATDATASDYEGVTYPVDASYSPWDNLINSTVMCPFNDNYQHYDNENKLYTPRDYRYFLEGLCTCFGWITHDTPSGIVFAKYDYLTNAYSQLSVAGLRSLTGRTYVQQLSTSFNLYYSNVDDNAGQTVVMPLKQIELNIEGHDVSNKKLSTQFTKTVDSMVGGASFRAVRLTEIGKDVNGTYMGTATFDTGGEITNNGLFPVAYGKLEPNALSIAVSESWVMKYSSSWGNIQLITAKFFGMAPLSSEYYCLLKLSAERGTSLQNMKTSGYSSFTLNIVISNGDQYYNLNNQTWGTSLVTNPVTFNGTTGKITPNTSWPSGQSIGPYTTIGDIDGIIIILNGAKVNDPIEITLYNKNDSGLNNNDYIRFTQMELVNPGDINVKYNEFYRNPERIVVGNNQTGTETRSLTVNFNNWVSNRGEHSFGSSSHIIGGSNPTFPYMFAPLHVLQEKVKKTRSISFNEYAAEWTYWISGWRWRMIAKNFNLRDDEYTITLARSSTIEH